MATIGNTKKGENNYRRQCVSLSIPKPVRIRLTFYRRQCVSLSVGFILSLCLAFLFSCAGNRQVPSADSLLMHQTPIGWIEAAVCKDIQEGEEAKPVGGTSVFTIQDKQAVMGLKGKDLKDKP